MMMLIMAMITGSLSTTHKVILDFKTALTK